MPSFQVYFDIILDQEVIGSVENPSPKQWTNVKIYAGLHKGLNYGVANAVIKDLQYETFTATTTTTTTTSTTTTTTTTPTTTTTTTTTG